jgi:hypothetical protein
MRKVVLKCDHCDKRADVKIGNGPEYLCSECWKKFYGFKDVTKGKDKD